MPMLTLESYISSICLIETDVAGIVFIPKLWNISDSRQTKIGTLEHVHRINQMSYSSERSQGHKVWIHAANYTWNLMVHSCRQRDDCKDHLCQSLIELPNGLPGQLGGPKLHWGESRRDQSRAAGCERTAEHKTSTLPNPGSRRGRICAKMAFT